MPQFDLERRLPPLKSPIVLRPADHRARFEREYRRFLYEIVTRTSRYVSRVLMPRLKGVFVVDRLSLMEQIADNAAFDEEDEFVGIFRLARDANEVNEDEVDRRLLLLLLGMSHQYDRDLILKIRRQFSIDLTDVLHDEDLTDMFNRRISENVALIKSLPQQALSRIEILVREAKLSGSSFTRLSKQIQEEFGVMKSRADLIARDQISKITADIHQERSVQAGVHYYRWSTSSDERVRPLHASLNGKIYRFGKETGAEKGLPPGKPIRCRCVAEVLIGYKPTRK